MSALDCVTSSAPGWMDDRRLLAHVLLEMGMAGVARRRAAGLPPVRVRPLEESTHAYFHRLRLEKEAALKGAADLEAPGPERTTQDPWPDGFTVPSGAASLVKLAEAAGWLVEVRYARGSVITRRKELGRIVERRHSVALRAWHPARNLHAVAVWESAVEAEKLSWKAELARSWKAGAFPEEVGVTALKEIMRERRGA